MIEQGEVVKVEPGVATVRLSSGENCASCSARGGCHMEVDLGFDKTRKLVAANRINARVGDTVEVLIPEQQRLQAGLIVFGLPVVLAVAGAIAGSLVGGDLAVLVGVLGGLGLGGAVGIDRMMERRAGLHPVVSKVTGHGAEQACH